MEDCAHGVATHAVREELQRILASADFDASERNRHFLRHVVEETLAGRSDRIKAYSIATSVFGRDASFDPQLDSIVRIEAGRLRRALERYYLTAGKVDSVRITIPRGGYVPVFEHDSAMPDLPVETRPSREMAHGRRGCTIVVSLFEEEGDHSTFPNFCRGLTRQVIAGLTRFTDLIVFGTESAMRRDHADGAASAKGDPVPADLLVTGGVMLSAGRFTLEVLLSDARSGRFIWGETFERRLDPVEITLVRDEVANSVVRSLAQPYGVIFTERAREVEGKPPESLTSYDSVIRFHQYARTYDRSLIASVRDGLEQAIRRDPGYAEAFACLALVYVNWVRFGHEPLAEIADPGKRALELALRAVELAPQSSRSHHALGLAYWFGGDAAAGLAALRTGLSLNQNDSEVMSELGMRHALLTEWDKALPLLEQSFARNPAQPGNSRVALALYHYMHRHYQDALMEMRRAKIVNVVPALLVHAAAAAKLGLTVEADAAVQAILRIDPAYGDHIIADLTARHVHPDIIAAILEGLREAGFPGRGTGLLRERPSVLRPVLRLHV